MTADTSDQTLSRKATIEAFFESPDVEYPPEHEEIVDMLIEMEIVYHEPSSNGTIPDDVKESALEVMSAEEYGLALKFMQEKQAQNLSESVG
jgi:hypothetical protein